MSGSWLDDIAEVIAAWRDRRPVLARFVLLLVVGATAQWYLSAPVFAGGVAALLLPRVRWWRGRGASIIGGLLAATGGLLILASPRDGWRWTPDTLGVWCLLVGILVGARRGRSAPWMLTALAVVPLHGSTVSGVWPDWNAVGAVLAIVLAARVAGAPRQTDASAALGRLSVRAQRRPWSASFVLCALAVAGSPVSLSGPPDCSVALICVAFHVAWRRTSLFDRVAPWAAILVVFPGALAIAVLLGRGGGVSAGDAAQAADFALSPAPLLPLLVGLAIGRGRPQPNERSRLLGGGALVAALCLPLATAASALSLHNLDLSPGTAGARLMAWWVAGISLTWLAPVHLIAVSSIPARHVFRGALAVGVAQVAMNESLRAAGLTPFGLGNPLSHPMRWLGVAVVALLAREISRVTAIPDEHPVIADWGGTADSGGDRGHAAAMR